MTAHSAINELGASPSTYKVVFIGDTGVGKTSMIRRYVKGEYS